MAFKIIMKWYDYIYFYTDTTECNDKNINTECNDKNLLPTSKDNSSIRISPLGVTKGTLSNLKWMKEKGKKK